VDVAEARLGREAARDAAVPARIEIPRAPDPSRHDLARSLAALVRTGARRARPSDLDARDEEFIGDLVPLMSLLYDRYFRCVTELEADVPQGPVLIVANHNGMTGTPDMFCHMTAFWRRYGTGRVGYGLMHDVPFGVPAAGAWLNAAGALAANHDNARRALERGAAVLVFPGGDVDACKPFGDRYKVDFGARRGFIRLALREQVPIVPLVSVGGHESIYLYTDGRGISRALRLDRFFRSNVWPVGLALPWGLVFGIPYPHLPPPVKIHSRILAPIRLDLPPSAADDAGAVDAAYARVVGAMQGAAYDLRDAGRHGLVPRQERDDLAARLFEAADTLGGAQGRVARAIAGLVTAVPHSGGGRHS
jgi:1-acyl-sn-glycerol-3-phosphate acyltransferase